MTLVTKVKGSRLLFDLVRRTPYFYSRALSRFQALNAASLEERKKFTENRLASVLASAEGSRYGKEFRSKPLEEWPFLDKSGVRANEGSFLTRPRWLTCLGRTSGSTGTPLSIFRSASSLHIEQASIDILYEMAGLSPKYSRVAVFRGDCFKSPSDMRPPYWKHVEGKRTLLFSSNHVQPSTIADIHSELQKFSPHCIFAYPSAAHSLCAQLKSQGKSLRVPLILTSSEVMQANTLTLIKEVLGGVVIDYYGQAERVAFAYSVDGAHYRFLPGYACVELRAFGQEAQSDLLEVVGTNLWNLAMPLIRYRTGDLISVPRGSDSTYLEEVRYGIRAFDRIIGRENDFIISPDGARLTGMTLIPRGITNVMQLQIIQEDAIHVTINVIPENGFHEENKLAIIANARMKIPDSMSVTISVRDSLEKAPSGKTPFVIRKID